MTNNNKHIEPELKNSWETKELKIIREDEQLTATENLWLWVRKLVEEWKTRAYLLSENWWEPWLDYDYRTIFNN